MLRPGWLVALCAAILAVSAWLPWLTTGADGGGRANAIGGVVGNMTTPRQGFGVGQLIVLLAATLIVAGEHPQLVVPPGHWQRARPRDDEPSLVSCVVIPGFDYADFALAAPTD